MLDGFVWDDDAVAMWFSKNEGVIVNNDTYVCECGSLMVETAVGHFCPCCDSRPEFWIY